MRTWRAVGGVYLAAPAPGFEGVLNAEASGFAIVAARFKQNIVETARPGRGRCDRGTGGDADAIRLRALPRRVRAAPVVRRCSSAVAWMR